MYHIRESIRPSADLRNHYNEISKQCREENEAVIITVNGRIRNVIKLRNDGFEGNTKNVLLFFLWKI